MTASQPDPREPNLPPIDPGEDEMPAEGASAEDLLDEALKESFPASDPISTLDIR